MIPFRHHVASLVAVFLALAAGIALGGGPLSELGREAPARTRPAAATGDRATARQADFAEAVLSAGAGRMAANGLQGRTVALVSFPGASSSTAEELVAAIEQSGGEVTGRYDVQPALVDASEKTLVDTLGSQLLTQLDSAGLDADAPTYARLGELMALAVGASGKGNGKGALNQDATSVVQSLEGAELMTAEGEPTGPASYVVLLLGQDTAEADDPIYSGLASGLAARAGAVVLVGTGADGADGRLSRIRGDDALVDLTTVDGVDVASGQLTTVLALTQWPATRGADYGASGADGAVDLG